MGVERDTNIGLKKGELKSILNDILKISKGQEDVNVTVGVNNQASKELRSISDETNKAAGSMKELERIAKSAGKQISNSFKSLDKINFDVPLGGKRKMPYSSLESLLPDDVKDIKEAIDRRKDDIKGEVQGYYSDIDKIISDAISYDPKNKKATSLYSYKEDGERKNLFNQREAINSAQLWKKEVEAENKKISDSIYNNIKDREKLYATLQGMQKNFTPLSDFSNPEKNKESLSHLSQMYKLALKIVQLDERIGFTNGAHSVDSDSIKDQLESYALRMIDNNSISKIFGGQFERVESEYDKLMSSIAKGLKSGIGDKTTLEVDTTGFDELKESIKESKEEYKNFEKYISDSKVLTRGKTAANAYSNLNKVKEYDEEGKPKSFVTSSIPSEEGRYKFVGEMANAIRNGKDFRGDRAKRGYDYDRAYDYYLQLLKEDSDLKEFANKILSTKPESMTTSQSPIVDSQAVKANTEKLKEYNNELERAKKLGIEVSEFEKSDSDDSQNIEEKTKALKRLNDEKERSKDFGVGNSKIDDGQSFNEPLDSKKETQQFLKEVGDLSTFNGDQLSKYAEMLEKVSSGALSAKDALKQFNDVSEGIRIKGEGIQSFIDTFGDTSNLNTEQLKLYQDIIRQISEGALTAAEGIEQMNSALNQPSTKTESSKNIPIELKQYWNELYDSIIQGILTEEQAIEKLNIKAQLLGKTFDKRKSEYIDLESSDMNLKVFDNQDAWEKYVNDGNDTERTSKNYVNVINETEKIMVDGEAQCRLARTAIDNFFNTLGTQFDDSSSSYGDISEWRYKILQSIKNGIYSELDPEGGYSWSVDKLDNGSWYIELNQIKDLYPEIVEEQKKVIANQEKITEKTKETVNESNSLNKQKVEYTAPLNEESTGQLAFANVGEVKEASFVIESAQEKVREEVAETNQVIEGQIDLFEYLESIKNKNTKFSSTGIEKTHSSYKDLLELQYDIKNVNKSYYSDKEHKYDWVGIYQSQEEAITQDLADKKNQLHSSLNLILSEDKNALIELEAEANKLKSSLQPVQDMVKRISSNSSIADLDKNKYSEDYYKKQAEAYKEIDDRLGVLRNKYELTNEELEEFVTLQLKAEKIIDSQIAHTGGVQGSGARDRNELVQWIEKSFASDLGFNPEEVYNGLFSNITNAWYDGNGFEAQPLYDDTGKRRNLRGIAGEILNYKGIGEFGVEEDSKKLRELNTILSYIKNNVNEINNTDFSERIKKASDDVEFWKKSISEGKDLDFYVKELQKSEEELQRLLDLQERLNASRDEGNKSNVEIESLGQLSENTSQDKAQSEINQTTEEVKELTQAEIECAEKAKEIGQAFGITDKKALKEIQDVLLGYKQDSDNVDMKTVLNTISENIKSPKDSVYKDTYQQIRDWINSSKIHVSDDVLNDINALGLKGLLPTIGLKNITTNKMLSKDKSLNKGLDIAEFLKEMNDSLGTRIGIDEKTGEYLINPTDLFQSLYDELRIKPKEVNYEGLPESIRETVLEILNGTYQNYSNIEDQVKLFKDEFSSKDLNMSELSEFTNILNQISTGSITATDGINQMYAAMQRLNDQQVFADQFMTKIYAADIFGGNAENAPNELRQYFETLYQSVGEGSISAEEAIDRFNSKAKELGQTFDETNNKWVKVGATTATTLPDESLDKTLQTQEKLANSTKETENIIENANQQEQQVYEETAAAVVKAEQKKQEEKKETTDITIQEAQKQRKAAEDDVETWYGEVEDTVEKDPNRRIAIKTTDSNTKQSTTYQEGKGRTTEEGLKYNKKTDEWEPFYNTLTNMVQVENEAVKWTNKLTLAQADLEAEMRKAEPAQYVLDAINDQIDIYQEMLEKIDKRAKELATENNSPFSYDDYTERVKERTDPYKTEISTKTAKQIRSENEALLKVIQQENKEYERSTSFLSKQKIKLDEIQHDYDKNLNAKKSIVNNDNVDKADQQKLIKLKEEIDKKIKGYEDQQHTLTSKEKDDLLEDIAKLKLEKISLQNKYYGSTTLSPTELSDNKKTVASNYDYLISKAKEAGTYTSDLVKRLEEERNTISQIGDSNGIKVVTDHLKAFRAEFSALQQQQKEKSKAYDDQYKVIEEYSKAQDVLNNLYIKQEKYGKSNELTGEIDRQTSKVKELEEAAKNAYNKIVTLFNTSKFITADQKNSAKNLLRDTQNGKTSSFIDFENVKSDKKTIETQNKNKERLKILQEYSAEQDKLNNLLIREEKIGKSNELTVKIDEQKNKVKELKTAVEEALNEIKRLSAEGEVSIGVIRDYESQFNKINEGKTTSFRLLEAVKKDKENKNNYVSKGYSQEDLSYMKDSISKSLKGVNTKFGIFDSFTSINKNGSATIKFINELSDSTQIATVKVKDLLNVLLEVENSNGNIDVEKFGEYNIKDINRKDVEKAYKTMADTEEEYRRLSIKRTAGTATNDELANLKSIQAARKEANAVIKQKVTATQEEIAAQKRYNEVQDQTNQKINQFVSEQQQVKSLMEVSSNMMDSFANSQQANNLNGFDDIYKYYNGKVEAANNKLMSTKNPTATNFDTYKKEILKIQKSLSSIVVGNVDIDSAEEAMRNYLHTIGAGANDIGKFDDNNKSLNATFKDSNGMIRNVKVQFDGLDNTIKVVSNTSEKAKSIFAQFFTGLKERVMALGQYLLSFASFYDVINVIRNGITTITELDTALTEMRKVSDESVESLKNFQKVSFDIAGAVGTTAGQIQNSTADWMGEILVPLYGNI